MAILTSSSIQTKTFMYMYKYLQYDLFGNLSEVKLTIVTINRNFSIPTYTMTLIDLSIQCLSQKNKQRQLTNPTPLVKINSQIKITGELISNYSCLLALQRHLLNEWLRSMQSFTHSWLIRQFCVLFYHTDGLARAIIFIKSFSTYEYLCCKFFCNNSLLKSFIELIKGHNY